jgi:hypothetical protein
MSEELANPAILYWLARNSQDICTTIIGGGLHPGYIINLHIMR